MYSTHTVPVATLTHASICIYIYIYMCRERERERKTLECADAKHDSQAQGSTLQFKKAVSSISNIPNYQEPVWEQYLLCRQYPDVWCSSLP